MARRQRHQAVDLAIGQHVSRRIGRARYADGAGAVAHVQGVEVHAVLEQMVFQMIDGGPRRSEKTLAQALIGVADVLRRKRQQHVSGVALLALAGENIEQHERRRLTAVGQRNVLGPDRPAELSLQQRCQGASELRRALGGAVVAHHALEAVAVVEDCPHAAAKQGLHRGDMPGISAAQHQHLAVHRHGLAQIVHQLGNAGVSAELVAEFGKLHLKLTLIRPCAHST